jgi:hypothetical protein
MGEANDGDPAVGQFPPTDGQVLGKPGAGIAHKHRLGRFP